MTKVEVILHYQTQKIKKISDIIVDCDLGISCTYQQASIEFTTKTKVTKKYIATLKKFTRERVEGEGYIALDVEVTATNLDNIKAV